MASREKFYTKKKLDLARQVRPSLRLQRNKFVPLQGRVQPRRGAPKTFGAPAMAQRANSENRNLGLTG